MFSVLDISKKTYYRYRNSEDKDYYDYVLIKEIFEEKKELDAEESIKNIPRRKVHNPDHDLGREM